jgi:hypothetical protein
MKYRLLTPYECKEHAVREPAVGFVDDNDQVIHNDVIYYDGPGGDVVLPYMSVKMEDLEEMLRLLKAGIQVRMERT